MKTAKVPAALRKKRVSMRARAETVFPQKIRRWVTIFQGGHEIIPSWLAMVGRTEQDSRPEK